MTEAIPLARGATAAPPDFESALRGAGLPLLARDRTTTLQINVGKLCDLACHHCHVEAGPKRTEILPERVAGRLLALLEASSGIDTVDLTGGAPEMNPSFRRLVTESRRLGRKVIDRCNLTVLFLPGQEDLAEFLAGHEVEIVASLPCYTAENVDRQRGRGVFGKSVDALRWLNRLGYGMPGSRLSLHLVYNPLGAFLPPPQAALEEKYREELRRLFGIEFHRLFTITNMPIQRFAHDLERRGETEKYLSLLVNHFNPATVPRLMCRSLVSVSWEGRIHDCDFNQMLDLETPSGKSIFDVDSLEVFDGRPIATGAHCFGCTAGAGSSCGGTLA